MILPFSPVVYGSISCLISINIVCDLRRIITKRVGSCDKQQENPRPLLRGHATGTEEVGRSELQRKGANYG